MTNASGWPKFKSELDDILPRVDFATRRWPLDIQLGRTVSSYDSLPFLFREAFPSVDSTLVATLGVFSRLFTAATLLSDRLVDSDADGSPLDVLRMIALHQESYRVLHALFPPQAAFWDRFQRHCAEFLGAMATEQQFVTRKRRLCEYTAEVGVRVAAGKTGLARTIVAALAELAHDDAPLADLTEALSEWGIAEQMFDDLRDWKKDAAHGIPSLLVALAAGALPDWPQDAPTPADIDRLSREIYYGDHAGHVLDIAVERLRSAERHRAKFPTVSFFRTVDALRTKCEALRRDVADLVCKNRERAGHRPRFVLSVADSVDPWLQTAWGALRFVHRQWELGFGEARDLARFPEVEGGFGPADTCYAGDVFQRAIIADALCDADQVLGGALQPVIEDEVEYFLSRRQTTGVGGWCYYFNLPELPPDVDDLGQIMQVLLRTNRRRDVVLHCERPLSVLRRDNMLQDGGFQTWIVPACDRTPIEQRQAYYVERSWGAGADCAAMANLLYALWLYDTPRFAETIRTGARFLLDHQHTQGHWQSGWYFDNHYATFACLRLLTVIHPDAGAVARAARFLREAQHDDGGWGILCGGPSDPFNTALAALALAVVPTDAAVAEDLARAEGARRFLDRTRLDDASWTSEKFIHVPGGRYRYGSRTITTAYVMKAMLAWQKVAGRRAARSDAGK